MILWTPAIADSSLELLNIHNAFHQGQFQETIDFDTTSFSSENTVSAQVLKYRAQIAKGQAKAVIDSVGEDANQPEFSAIKAFALYCLGNEDEAQQEVDRLVEYSSENAVVQILGAQYCRQSAGRMMHLAS